MKKFILVAPCAMLLVFNSGCTAIIAAQLRGKLPSFAAKEIQINATLAGVGGGSIQAKGVKQENGRLMADEYHEQVTSGASTIKIDAIGAELSAPQK